MSPYVFSFPFKSFFFLLIKILFILYVLESEAIIRAANTLNKGQTSQPNELARLAFTNFSPHDGI
jgi:hypothetical protein